MKKLALPSFCCYFSTFLYSIRCVRVRLQRSRCSLLLLSGAVRNKESRHTNGAGNNGKIQRIGREGRKKNAQIKYHWMEWCWKKHAKIRAYTYRCSVWWICPDAIAATDEWWRWIAYSDRVNSFARLLRCKWNGNVRSWIARMAKKIQIENIFNWCLITIPGNFRS